jgi:transitional endoplasmic reticulum ATPase
MVKLRVAEAFSRDAGRGIARLGTKAQRNLELIPGDILEIIGKHTTARAR